MPLIPKPNYNQIFASQAPDIDKPAVFNNYPEGWGPESRPNNGKPTIKGFNYLQQTSDLKDLWILQNGACLPYDESIEYAEGAPVLKDGVIQYKTASGFVNALKTHNSLDGRDAVGAHPASAISYGSINQEDYNNGLESITEMLAIQNPVNGMRVYVKSYHAGLNKGGGTFVYNSAKALINDGVVCFNGWVRASFVLITSSMAGCKIDGVTDDTSALQRGADYASSNGFTVLLDSGEHLLDDLKFYDPTNLYAQRGLNAFYFIKLKSGTHILGSKGSVIKVADGQLFKSFDYVGDIHTGTYLNWQMPGTKGFQVFAQVDVDEAVVDVSLMNFTIDMNGYNNKIQPLNNFSNQSQCQAVYGLTGDNWLISEVKFKDSSGSQVICLMQGVTNAKVRLNEFIDCGNLDGTNTHLDDHSTIYTMGAGTIVEQNKLTQSVQWVGKGGSPIETHGAGATVRNNYIEKYLSMGVCASAVTNSKINYVGNIGRSISAIGLDCYCLNGNTFDLTAHSNDVEIINIPLASDHPAFNHRNFILTKYFDYSPGKSRISLQHNQVVCKNKDTLSNTEKQYNSIVHSRLVSNLELANNIFEGFGGGLVNLDIQQTLATLSATGNKLKNCGYSDEFKGLNSLINYTNGGDVSYGVSIDRIELANNVYEYCKYSSYIGLNCVVLGNPIAPHSFKVVGDAMNNWMTTTWSATGDVALGTSEFQFEYTCTSPIDGDNLLKVLPVNNNYLSQQQYGEIKVMAITVQNFTTLKGVAGWVFRGMKFDGTPPAAGEGSPFGDTRGDRLDVMFTGFVGTPTAYVYTLLDANGNYGWRPYGVITS